MASILIEKGTLLTATGRFVSDIYIKDGCIAQLGQHLRETMQADTTIDAGGMLVFPGGIDPHTHLDMPFMGTRSADDFTTGTIAALHGGTTSVIDYAIQSKGKGLNEALDTWMGLAEGKACCDYGFHIAVTDFNDQVRSEVAQVVKRGMTSFKTFMAYKGSLMIDDRQMLGIMEEAKKCGALIAVHGTNGDMIDYLVAKHAAEGKLTPLYHYRSQPELVEEEASGRFCDLAYQAGARAYIVHLTCQGALDKVRKANLRNQHVLVETCPQYLTLDASVYEREDAAKWVMSPPIREKKDQEALWAGLRQGLVQVLATDHCPFSWEQKQLGCCDFRKIPNGGAGIEHRLELLWSEGVAKGRIDEQTFVAVTSTNAARIFGMPKKGVIAVGADADLVLFNPNETHTITAATHHMRVDYSNWEGWMLTGKVKKVFLRGQVVVDEGKTQVKPGNGRYVARTC